MNQQKTYKIVKEEIEKALFEDMKNSGGTLSDLVTKFYMFIIKNDLESAKKTLQQNPELLQAAEEIKQQSEILAKELLKSKGFVKFLLGLKDTK